jgi:hypothetical protein
MKEKQSQYYKQTFAGIVILGAYLFAYFQFEYSIGERISLAGFCLMMGFLFTTIIGGIIKDVPKTKIIVPVKPAMLVISIAVLHFIIGAYLDGKP